MKERNREIITSMVFLAFSLFGWYLTREIPEPFRDYDLGAAFLPRLVLGLIGALAMLKLVIAVVENKQNTGEKKEKAQLARAAVTIAMVGLYCFCYKPVGFLVDTAVYLFAQIMLLTPKSKRCVWKILLIDLVATVAIYLLFSRGFSVRLPQGLIKFI